MIEEIGALLAATPFDEIGLAALARKLHMKPYVLLAIGGIAVYLAVTNKAKPILSSLFGKK